MGYKIGAIANLLVLIALGLHHWQYPNAENWIYALLGLPLVAVLVRWARVGNTQSLIPTAYRIRRRLGYLVGLLFVWMALVGAVMVFPVFLEIARGTQYLYFTGAPVAASAFLFAIGFLAVELDLRAWEKLGAE